MGRPECPNDERLRVYCVGDLPAEEFDHTAKHVVACSECAARAAQLDGCADDLLDDLRTVADPDDTVDVPEPLLLAARNAFSEREGSGISPNLLDRGSALTRRLSDGGPVSLGRFEIQETLGSGAFGSVFKAHDTELDRTVAIKIQRTPHLGGSAEQDRFLREARSVAQLNHPHVISLYETGQLADGACYLVSEFVAGETLEQRLRRGPLAPRSAAALVRHVAEALHSAHEHGVIHRDVKPSNILIDGQGNPHVTDFGLAKREEGEITMTSDGAIMGTPAYMSPELAQGQSHHVDARSDVFSLGVILYEVLAGHRPFQGNRRMVMLQIIEDDPRPLRQLNERVPRDLETICHKAMAKNPARRYASAGAFAEDLARYQAGEPILARPIGRLERLWHWSRRNPFAASVILAIIAGSSIGFWHLSKLSEQLVQKSARDSARMHARILEAVNSQYSAKIVARLGEHGVIATHEYATREGTIPLPATFLTELGDRISADTTGMVVRHYSDFPFASRTNGGPRDDFEHEALRQLRSSPVEPFYRFQADGHGGYTLRYATARVMEASCVHCHNNHADSTRRDWQVGDVRGVLEIIRPLDEDVAQIGAHLRGTFLLTGVTSCLFLVLTVAAIVINDRLRRARLRAPVDDADHRGHGDPQQN